MIGVKPRGPSQHAASVYPALMLIVFFVVPFAGVDHGDGIGNVAFRSEGRDISERFGRRLRCQTRGRIETRIGRPTCH